VENNPLISVLLPVYKHEAYLMEAVQSIINQTFTDWELLILTDDPELNSSLYDYCELDERIIFYGCDKNKGKWYRINEGLAIAQGDFIAFQDADDISIPHRFAVSLQNIGDADFLYGDAIAINQDNTHSYLKCQDIDINNRPLGNQGSYFFRKSDISYPEIGRGDDWLFVAKCLKAGMKFRYLELPLYYYRDYTGNFRKNSNKIKRYFSNRKLKKIVNQITQS